MMQLVVFWYIYVNLFVYKAMLHEGIVIYICNVVHIFVQWFNVISLRCNNTDVTVYNNLLSAYLQVCI